MFLPLEMKKFFEKICDVLMYADVKMYMGTPVIGCRACLVMGTGGVQCSVTNLTSTIFSNAVCFPW